MYIYKNSQIQDMSLKQSRMVFEAVITGNATPADVAGIVTDMGMFPVTIVGAAAGQFSIDMTELENVAEVYEIREISVSSGTVAASSSITAGVLTLSFDSSLDFTTPANLTYSFELIFKRD